jgi:acetyltransferase-like isoleucine patch superfamily enzyme
LGLLEWAQRRETPSQQRAWNLVKSAARMDFPVVPGLHRLLLAERRFRRGPMRLMWSKLYSAPLLRLQCEQVGAGLLLFEDMPKILGNLRVRLGERVTLDGEQVWVAGGSGEQKLLEIGDDTGIGFRTEFGVGSVISIGRHVLIGARSLLLGFDGHPLDPYARAGGKPPGPDGMGAITIKDYAWIGSDSIIMKRVTIGRGAIVASGSVVKTDVPDLTVVAGNPARTMWRVAPPEGW